MGVLEECQSTSKEGSQNVSTRSFQRTFVFARFVTLSLISILTHVDLVRRRVFFMVSEVQIIVFQLFMEDTVVGVKSTTYSALITSGFLRTNNNNNKRIF